GSEAYTRAGSLEVDEAGQLKTKSGHLVLGDGGPITIPPDNHIEIGADGTVSIVPSFGTPNNVNPVGRLKLVNPPEQDIVRGADGVFRLNNGQSAPADENVRVSAGTLEGSNVNVTDAMVNLISLSRQFELQIKMMQTADQNAQRADQLLSMSG
ncbi:MAG: flagellar basal body rod protein FlgF, partial [Azonexus sp.]|nr:flagellar basal body rod protein FlgF [Azonexus sp.]